jgi:hypothetical protein
MPSTRPRTVFSATVALLFAVPASAAPPARETKQVDTGQYELKLEEIRTCESAPATTDPAGKPATRRIWVGAAVHTRAKVNELFITARDFSIERGGVIVQAKHVDPPALARCKPLLQAKQLRPQQSVRGFVLFEMPPSFTTGPDPIVLAFRPTRWGGAARAEFKIPSCLDSCPKGKHADVTKRQIRLR